MGVTIICGDVSDLPIRGKFHAILSDPPYELGFMGKAWDGRGVAYDVDMWAAIMDLLRPGAFGMAWGGSRTYHRLACAIEDAGAELHPLIYAWAFGSGFPKATRIDTQIDKAAGAEREVVEARYAGRRTESSSPNNGDSCYGQFDIGDTTTAPATPLAQAWEGHRYGKQALKPAVEPICCFQVPYEGRPVDCITSTGAGALNIDGGRVGTDDKLVAGGCNAPMTGDTRTGKALGMYQPGTPNTFKQSPSGRWPSNLVLCHTPECGDDCSDGCAVKALGEQSGERPGGAFPEHQNSIGTGRSTEGLWQGNVSPARKMNDAGTAARFFQQVSWQLDNAEPVKYMAKAGRAERDAGLDGRELQEKRTRNSYGDQSEYECPDGAHRVGNKGTSMARNNHPTIKPLELTRYLATLLLPPPEYAPRRILIPFGGVGSEAIGAMLAGWDEIVMIEQSYEYCQIAQARVKWWAEQIERYDTVDTKELIKLAKKESKMQAVML